MDDVKWALGGAGAIMAVPTLVAISVDAQPLWGLPVAFVVVAALLYLNFTSESGY